MALRLTGFSTFLLFAAGCGVIEVPPPKAPDPVMPKGLEMPAKAPEAGKTRVVVDADGQRVLVNEVTSWSSGHGFGANGFVSGQAENVKPLCVAPCVVDLEPGVHVLRFADERDSTRHGEARIQLGEKPKLVRHVMGRTKMNFGGMVMGDFLIIFGATGVLTGAGMMAAGAAGKKDELVTGAGITLGIGASLLLLGIPMAVASQPHVQEGATSERTIDR